MKTLKVIAGVRYWEDAYVNGISDDQGDMIPCREGDNWCPVIDMETGTITNWKQGTIADIHYKVCDDGEYFIHDENENIVHSTAGYVPEIMSPGGRGYGDYIIMNVDENGKISHWKVTLNGF